MATQDVALLVPLQVPAAAVQAALVAGVRGSDYPGLLEDVRLFDVYTGEQAGRRAQVAGVHAAVPRPGPHADRGGDDRGPGRRGGRGGPPGGRGAARPVLTAAPSRGPAGRRAAAR